MSSSLKSSPLGWPEGESCGGSVRRVPNRVALYLQSKPGWFYSSKAVDIQSNRAWPTAPGWLGMLILTCTDLGPSLHLDKSR